VAWKYVVVLHVAMYVAVGGGDKLRVKVEITVLRHKEVRLSCALLLPPC
jgi:hypothetical protein